MNSTEVMKRDKQYIMGTYARNELCIEKGMGATCYSPEGKKYIDFSSGIGVNALGFAHPEWTAAVAAQAGMLQHTSNLFYTKPCGELAELLIKRTGFSKVFFCNSGAEANEGAIKTARKYSHMKYGNERYEIITLVNSFHGRTLATITATGQEDYHKYFDPFVEGFVYAEANDYGDLAAKVSDKTCAIMVEFVQGEGGVNTLDQGYIRAIADLCKEKDILFIADEVQTGIGRTGKLFAYQHYGIKPDLVTMAKGLGGGLPIGGILFNESCDSVLQPGDHGTTYGGNPVACAGGLAVLKKMDEAFLKTVAEKGAYMRSIIEKMAGVEKVTGLGLMLGIAPKAKDAKEVVKSALDTGLIVLTAKDKVRLLPPLNITDEELEEGLKLLEAALKNEEHAAYLILEDGTVYEGKGFGAKGSAIGEVVFTTGMTGYQETLTDPSYYGQLVTQTFPLIGNYGINEVDGESEKAWMKGYIVREWCEEPSNFRCGATLDEYLKTQNVVGIYDIDTRALTKKTREHGVMNGAITTELPGDMGEFLKKLRTYTIKNAVSSVSCTEKTFHQAEDAKFHVVLLDYGAKTNILRSLLERGCSVTVVSHNTTAEEIKEMKPDGIMLSNGPGDPAENKAAIAELKKLMSTEIPIFGICLGHQLLALANGAKTEKLKYGHRGANQPVVDRLRDRVFITSQNHGYAVLGNTMDEAVGFVSHHNANDGSCEGITYKNGKAFTVQFHPEACSGPLDTKYLFDTFIAMMNQE